MLLTEENKANRTEQDRTEGTVVATAVCISSRLTPPSPRGSTGERGGCQQKVLECGFVCQRKKEQRKRECACVCVGVSDLCPHVWLSPPRAGQNGTGRRAPNWAQMAATDRDGGGINTLINNFLNNDTRYTRVGGRGTEGQEGRRRLRVRTQGKQKD